jgi:hypothetical protein
VASIVLHLGPAGDFDRKVLLDLGDFLRAGGYEIDPNVPGRKLGVVPGIKLPVAVAALEYPDHSISMGILFLNLVVLTYSIKTKKNIKCFYINLK